MLILDVGCGENKLELPDAEIRTVDCREEVNPTIVSDVRDLWKIPAERYDMVYSSHTLEHIGRSEIFSTLKEWMRVLKPKGKLKVIVPNLEWAAKRILMTNPENANVLVEGDVVLSVLYGDQTYHNNFHRMGFTPRTIRREFELLGLKAIKVQTYEYNIEIEGVK